MVIVTNPGMLLTRAEAAEVARTDPERIRGWERRGHLERAGLDDRGWPMYRALDVAKAAHKLRCYTRAG
jgi:hypothetical protein